MKNILKKIITWIKEKQYLIYFIIGMGILDFYLRFINRTMKSFSVLDLIPNVFTIIWILVFCIILYISNKTLKKIFTIIFSLCFVILSYTHIIFSRIFSKFFSFNDLIYTSEGMDFFSSIFGYIKVSDIIILILFIIFIGLSIFTYRFIKKESKKQKIITVVVVSLVIIILTSFVQFRIGKSVSTIEWSSFANKRNIYNQFNDTKRSMMLCGLYEYTFRDFYLTFLKKDNIDYTESMKEINEFFNSNDKSVSDYNGIFEDKSLILIMMENIDTWMINKKVMPTLYNLKKNSIDFIGHYSATYASGFTFNTEFITNTGVIPNITTLKTSYSYNRNNYEYSLPNLFKKSGYIVNSIHKNKGEFYNRDNMHIAWGYENHYDYSKLETGNANLDLDTTVVSNNLDKFIYDDKFMTFYITYSAHMPFQYSKKECNENIEYIKENFDSENEEYLCALSQAKVTDDAIKLLMDELEKQELLEDTVLVFYSDHYAYSMNKELISELKDESDTNLKSKTPFFIYNNGDYVEEIDKVNSSVDILPTVADLFGLDYNPNIYFGSSIFNYDYKGIVVFSDKTWYDGNIYYKGEGLDTDEDYINEVNAYVDKLLSLGGKIIETDYFRTYNLENEKR